MASSLWPTGTVTVSELKAGTTLTASVPHSQAKRVYVSSVREAELLRRLGNSLIVRGQDGVKRYVVDGDFKFLVYGRYVDVFAINPPMKLTAVIVTETAPVVVEATGSTAATDKAAEDAAARRSPLARRGPPAAGFPRRFGDCRSCW